LTNEIDEDTGIESILPWDVFSAADRMILVFEISSALKVVHMLDLLHRDLKHENVMIDENGRAKLADFGGTKDQASVDAGSNQTGIFTWGWADANAREGKYSKECEVYSFACLGYYILRAKPLFSRDHPYAYLNNTTKVDHGWDNSTFL
jgi:serine/threonine protein kinase